MLTFAAVRRRGWFGAAVAAVATFVVAAGAVVLPLALSRGSGPPAVGPFSPPTSPYRVTEVVDAGERGIVLGDRSLDMGNVPVERAVAITRDELHAGTTVVAIGIPNEVRNYAIVLLVVVEGGVAGREPPRTKAGFYGHEPFGDDATPVAWGTVVAITEDELVLDGPGGTMTLTIGEGAPLVRFESALLSELRPGDRLAARVNESQRVEAALAVPKSLLPEHR